MAELLPWFLSSGVVSAIALVVLLGLLAWALLPYFNWRDVHEVPLEAYVARTSFQAAPGELIPPAWKPPAVTLSVVVPAYNEEFRLPQMLDETLTYLESRAAASPSAFSYEVVVVDDGSVDSTYAAALAVRPSEQAKVYGELRVLQLRQNCGKGFAVRAGMLVARGSLLLMADADGATSIRDLERLELALERHKADGTQMAFGSRHHLQDDALRRRSWLRNVLMRGFHFVVWIFVGGHIRDTQCGFKLFHASVGKQIFASLHLYRWAFDTEIVVLAGLLGKNIAEVPVTFTDIPGSKLNLLTGSITMLRDIVLLRVLFLLGVWHPAVAA
eukprot:gnl/TRDRNA2_/TRDRNA2_193037_c0_seq1.p1 gnl/TRDRNA2_/TRDRNA2_193037_c0~~gnl/TRDRNA2_/TRDRNA2_193037_c0_seq1.p1  ORF type:complete len:329 (+),score=52.95 gnl/TRDRNA2_/TRDRNA2_193037_c0_seq1:43-1029(+)